MRPGPVSLSRRPVLTLGDSTGDSTYGCQKDRTDSSGNSGAGIYSIMDGTVTTTIKNGTLSGNSATANGGGFFGGGALTIENSTLSGNSATYNCGAIYFH